MDESACQPAFNLYHLRFSTALVYGDEEHKLCSNQVDSMNSFHPYTCLS